MCRERDSKVDVIVQKAEEEYEFGVEKTRGECGKI